MSRAMEKRRALRSKPFWRVVRLSCRGCLSGTSLVTADKNVCLNLLTQYDVPVSVP